MSKYDKMDLALSNDGDLIIENGGLQLARRQNYLRQQIESRVKTSDPEWKDYIVEEIGANLEDLRGLPNTRETADIGIRMLRQALTRDGLIDSEDLYIRPVPFSKEILVFYIMVNVPYNGGPIAFEVSMDFHSGMNVRRVQ